VVRDLFGGRWRLSPGGYSLGSFSSPVRFASLYNGCRIDSVCSGLDCTLMEQPQQPHALPPSAAPSPIRRTRVLCVDDSPDIGKMLARLIREQPDLEDAGVLDRAEGLVDEVIGRRADVVVLDLTMPGFDPVVVIRALAVRLPSCRVIAFSGYDDPDTKDEVRCAGAWGLVSKHGESADIIRAIRLAGAESTPQATRPAPSGVGGASDAAHHG